MSNLGSSYTKILGLLHELESRDNYHNQIRTPKLSDKQLIALVLAAESLGLDSERHLFRQLPGALARQIDRSVFNRRRRQYQHDLFDAAAIRLETPMRHNQLNHKPFNPLLRKARKRIETLFSQLCDQFMIRRNYAKSFQGLATRVLSKLTALTFIQWLNRRNGTHLNNLKPGFA